MKRVAMGAAGVVLVLSAAACSSSGKNSASLDSGASGAAGSSVASNVPTNSSPAKSSPAAPAQLTSTKAVYVNLVPDVMPLVTANDDGFMAKQGLNVSATKVAGTAAVQSLVSGQVAFDIGGVTDALSAAAAGADVRIIGMLDYYDAHQFVVSPSIKTPADLAGKTYAGTSAAGTATLCLKQVMQHFNIADYKITLLNSVPNMFSAVSNGAASGYCADAPDSTVLQSKGYNVMWDLAADKIEDGQVGVVTSESEIKNHPDVVQKFMNALQQVLIDEHDPSRKAHYVAAWAKAIGGDYTTDQWGDAFDLYTQQVTGPDMVPTVQVLSANKDALVKSVPAMANLDLATVIDPTFAQNAKASYGGW